MIGGEWYMSAAGNEKGYASTSMTDTPHREKVSALRWPQNQQTYMTMLRTSSKVKQIRLAITEPIKRSMWSVAANGAPDEIVQHVADDLRLPVHGAGKNQSHRRSSGSVSWSKHLHEVLLAPFRGCAYFEQVYRVGADGKLHLHKLAQRPTTSLKKIHVADDGGLEGVTQWSFRGRSETFIPVRDLVAYVFDELDTSWRGESLLRPAHKHWLAVADLEKLEFDVLHRNGMGFPVHKQSIHTPEAERTVDARRGLEIATGVYAGDSAGATLKPGEDLELLGVTGKIVDIDPAIQRHNNRIAEAVLANFLNLDGGGGSYALAGTQADFFFQMLQSIADWVADVANQHIIEDLVSLAYPDYDGPAPMLSMTPIAAKKHIQPGEIAQLVAQGALLKEPNLEQWLRQNYDIPAARSLYDAIAAKKNQEEAEEAFGVKLSDNTSDDQEDTTNAREEREVLNMLAAMERDDPPMAERVFEAMLV